MPKCHERYNIMQHCCRDFAAEIRRNGIVAILPIIGFVGKALFYSSLGGGENSVHGSYRGGHKERDWLSWSICVVMKKAMFVLRLGESFTGLNLGIIFIIPPV